MPRARRQRTQKSSSKPKSRAAATRKPRAAPSKRAKRTQRVQRAPRAPREAPPMDLASFESAFRTALRDEVGRPLAEMMDRLSRVADELSWRARPLEGMFTEELAQVFELAPEAPPPEPSCAVIGCENPRGELGYCKAHQRQRQQMLDAGRLHPEWVENAAPHSVPKVIPPRGPRGERQPRATVSAPAAEVAPRPATEPRMFVRRKKADAAVTPSEPTSPEARSAVTVEPRSDEHQQIASTLGRWANEFKARK